MSSPWIPLLHVNIFLDTDELCTPARLSLPYEGSDPLGVFPPQPCTLEMSLKAVNHPRAIKAGEGVAADPAQQQQQQQQQKLFDPPLSAQRLQIVKRVAQEVNASSLIDAGEPDPGSAWLNCEQAYASYIQTSRKQTQRVPVGQLLQHDCCVTLQMLCHSFEMLYHSLGCCVTL